MFYQAFLPLDERVPEEVIWGEVPESQVSIGSYTNGFDTPNSKINGKKEEPPQEEEPNSGGIFGWFKKKVGKIDMGDDKGYTN